MVDSGCRTRRNTLRRMKKIREKKNHTSRCVCNAYRAPPVPLLLPYPRTPIFTPAAFAAVCHWDAIGGAESGVVPARRPAHDTYIKEQIHTWAQTTPVVVQTPFSKQRNTTLMSCARGVAIVPINEEFLVNTYTHLKLT